MTPSTPPPKQTNLLESLKHFISILPRQDPFEPFKVPYTYISTLAFLLTGKRKVGVSLTMSSQKYERVSLMLSHAPVLPLYVSGKAEADIRRLQVSANDEEYCQDTSQRPSNTEATPSSPPPSFRSRASSPSSRHLLSEDPIITEAERTLADTFDDGSDSDDDGHNEGDDRQRLMRANTHQSQLEQRAVHDGNGPNLSGAVTRLPVVVHPVSSNVPARPYTGATPYSTFSHSNDGVFANLNAKPERGEKLEEQPPVSTLVAICLWRALR